MVVGIEIIVYIYGIICLILVVYSIFYALKEKELDQINDKRAMFWEKTITEECMALVEENKLSKKHKKLLLSKLTSLNQLIAFQKAFQKIQEEQTTDQLKKYLLETIPIFQVIGMRYSKRESMEKAYFAYVVETCWIDGIKEYDMLIEILVSYLIDTTIYCRENVLKALYRIGNVQAVENAFRVLNDYHYFHHTKLLSDGLMTFCGDKNLLAKSLWKHHMEWRADIMVAIIQFITRDSEDFIEVFWEVMNNPKIHIEIRLAIIRYYKKYYFAPVGERLRQYVKESDEKNTTLGIVAVSALENYPGEDTMFVLKKALHHKDWYIRHNAAAALIYLGITDKEINEIIGGADRYASEMLCYMIRMREPSNKGRMGATA